MLGIEILSLILVAISVAINITTILKLKDLNKRLDKTYEDLMALNKAYDELSTSRRKPVINDIDDSSLYPNVIATFTAKPSTLNFSKDADKPKSTVMDTIKNAVLNSDGIENFDRDLDDDEDDIDEESSSKLSKILGINDDKVSNSTANVYDSYMEQYYQNDERVINDKTFKTLEDFMTYMSQHKLLIYDRPYKKFRTVKYLQWNDSHTRIQIVFSDDLVEYFTVWRFAKTVD